MKRTDYWNEEYVRYWKKRTSNKDSLKVEEEDFPPNVELFGHYYERIGHTAGKKTLEVGVGFGRLVPWLYADGCEVFGVDISLPMIIEARATHDGPMAQFHVAAAEELPYHEAFFDIVLCWGVFDACYQAAALSEMARVLKIGGKLLLSGKNDNYHDDDELAYVAEVNARKKGHPNYFTDFSSLLHALRALGLRDDQMYFFHRRGDSSEGRYTTGRIPAQFYPYNVTYGTFKTSSMHLFLCDR